MKSMANRFRNGVFAAFFVAMAFYLLCYLFLAVSSGPYSSSGRMDAETVMRLSGAGAPVLRIMLSALGSAMAAVFLFASIRLSRRSSGIIALAFTLLLTGVQVLPSLVIMETIRAYSILPLLLSEFSLLTTALLYWLLTPWLARRTNEPLSLAIVLLLNGVLSFVFLALVSVLLPLQNLATFGALCWTAFKGSVSALLQHAVIVLPVYALLYGIFRPKKAPSPEGLDNG